MLNLYEHILLKNSPIVSKDLVNILHKWFAYTFIGLLCLSYHFYLYGNKIYLFALKYYSKLMYFYLCRHCFNVYNLDI